MPELLLVINPAGEYEKLADVLDGPKTQFLKCEKHKLSYYLQ